MKVKKPTKELFKTITHKCAITGANVNVRDGTHRVSGYRGHCARTSLPQSPPIPLVPKHTLVLDLRVQSNMHLPERRANGAGSSRLVSRYGLPVGVGPRAAALSRRLAPQGA